MPVYWLLAAALGDEPKQPPTRGIHLETTTAVNFTEMLAALSHAFPGTSLPGKTRGTGSAAATNQPSPLHLFHAANSICSQKVRTVLCALQQPYISHQMNIFAGDTYHPHYVRLRAHACQSLGYRLADQHTGSTSVLNTGCDACVVPTLLDASSERVLIDSRRICMALIERAPIYAERLLPSDHTEAISLELDVIDDFPNYPILAHKIDRDSGAGDSSYNVFSMKKVERCETLMQEYADEPLLSAAYRAKRDKEKSAAYELFDDASMGQTMEKIAAILTGLNARLSSSRHQFLFADSPTLADYFWGLELMRLDDLNMSALWQNDDDEGLQRYYRRLGELPALDQAVTQWPGARLSSQRQTEQAQP
ncbi:glutathione S-transferase domain-containing protein [Pseudomaricurvus alkylphenolicus]|uniref:glutathione S-transferase family protein n=1 Tax=Pseudomaricurvus alkylphenolicus TaxID=1306991 RepID=UPI00141E20E6|nr:glutathione S-transferase domain-containing protein [Pseudomaricurvus alkylphenolicus]NIB43388.1 glutathione S-transferase domain-containing protein [Pseudomaricurvus alkylphenolicus]